MQLDIQTTVLGKALSQREAAEDVWVPHYSKNQNRESVEIEGEK
jgi:hypothetical protein